MRAAFLDQQLTAQIARAPGSVPERPLVGGRARGCAHRSVVHMEGGDGVHVVDLALLPEHRGAGVGEALLTRVVGDGRRVSLSVVRTNPAQRLYRRLGFEVVDEDDVYLHMQRPPAQLKTAS